MASGIVPSRGRRGPGESKVLAFPRQQLFILALCRICEPIAFMSIFPYSYYLVASYNFTDDEKKIAVYAGLITSAFAFAEFSTSVIWGRISDRIGRKPVLIGGLAGTGLSMILFGFAPNLPMALLARALGGLLNGNIGVLQTTVAEIVTIKEHQPRAYAIMPFVWCLGSILGPALGGALAQPCISYPAIFARGTIFDKYPFLLPNLVCTIILACGVVIGILFLEETHQDKKHRRDIGIETGKRIVSLFRLRRKQPEVAFHKVGDANLEETVSLLEDEEPPFYRTNENSPHLPSSRAHSPMKNEKPKRSRGARKAFTRQVIVNIVGYGILAFHTITFDQMMPIFLAEDGSEEPVSLPFKFLGGFELSSKSIGLMISLQGVSSMIAQVFLFPVVVRRFGNLKTFRFIVISWPLLYLMVPYTVLLPYNLRLPAIGFCLVWRIIGQVFAYPCNAILLTNSAPSMLVLGMINGAAASTASLCRAFGPAVAGVLHDWGNGLGYNGFAWWAGGFVCMIGALESLWIEEGKGRMDRDRDEDLDEESTPGEPLIDPLAIDAAITEAKRPGNDAEGEQ